MKSILISRFSMLVSLEYELMDGTLADDLVTTIRLM